MSGSIHFYNQETIANKWLSPSLLLLLDYLLQLLSFQSLWMERFHPKIWQLISKSWNVVLQTISKNGCNQMAISLWNLTGPTSNVHPWGERQTKSKKLKIFLLFSSMEIVMLVMEGELLMAMSAGKQASDL